MKSQEYPSQSESGLSVDAMRQAVEQIYVRRSEIELEFIDLEDFSQTDISEPALMEQGFRTMMIVHKPYALFFLSNSSEIESARNEFFADKGEPKFYQNQRTEEVVVFLK